MLFAHFKSTCIPTVAAALIAALMVGSSFGKHVEHNTLTIDIIDQGQQHNQNKSYIYLYICARVKAMQL